MTDLVEILVAAIARRHRLNTCSDPSVAIQSFHQLNDTTTAALGRPPIITPSCSDRALAPKVAKRAKRRGSGKQRTSAADIDEQETAP